VREKTPPGTLIRAVVRSVGRDRLEVFLYEARGESERGRLLARHEFTEGLHLPDPFGRRARATWTFLAVTPLTVALDVATSPFEAMAFVLYTAHHSFH